MAARDRVLTLPELLEPILLHLPIEDLLVTAQRVSKLWRKLINNSIVLQRALFLRPTPTTPDSSGFQQKRNPFCHLLAVREYTNHTPAFDRPEASWRRMLILQPPVPMRWKTERRTVVFTHDSDFAPGGEDGRSDDQIFHSLTFGDVENAMTGRRMNVIVQNRDLVWWQMLAFEHEADGLHWTTL